MRNCSAPRCCNSTLLPGRAWYRPQIGFGGFGRTAGVCKSTSLSFHPFRRGRRRRRQIKRTVVKECGPFEGQRGRGSFPGSARLDGGALAIVRPSVVFEERFGIVDSLADERVSDERVNAPCLVRRDLRGECLADTVVIGLDALGGSAAANEVCCAKTGDERSRVARET